MEKVEYPGTACKYNTATTLTVSQMGRIGWKDGPKRSCTDVFCLFIFALFSLGSLVVACIAFLHGDINRLIYPTDSEGRLCGLNNGEGFDYSDKPNLFFFDLIGCFTMGFRFIFEGCSTSKICVASCPSGNLVVSDSNFRELVTGGYCLKSSSPKLDDCPKYTLTSSEFYSRCVPVISENLIENTVNSINLANSGEVDIGNILELARSHEYYLGLTTLLSEALEDIYDTKYELLCFFGIGFLVSLLLIFLIRYFVGPVIGFLFLSTLFSLGFGIYYFFDQYLKVKKLGGSAWPTSLSLNIKSYGDYYNVNLTVGIILSVLLLIIILVVLAVRKNIRSSIQLLREASKALGHIWGLFLWIMIPIVEIVVVTFLYIAIAAFLYSMGSREYARITGFTVRNYITIVVDSVKCNEKDPALGLACRFVKYGDVAYRPYIVAYVVFMWFWTVQLILDFSICVISGSFIKYYWTMHKPRDIPAFPVLTSIWTVLRYHLGSVAFGSFIISLVKFVRIGLDYLSGKLKKYNNVFTRVVLKMMKCCFHVFEKFIKFLTANSYIQMMASGKGFCPSARKVFFLIVENVVGKFVLVVFTRIVVCFCILGSTAITLLCSYLWFIPNFAGIENLRASLGLADRRLNHSLVPIGVVVTVSLIVNIPMFMIYGMGADSLFICYLNDLADNDGSKEKPYYMSKNLRRILGKGND